MARGSLYETLHWLRRAHARELLRCEEIECLKGFTNELGLRLNAYARSLRKRMNSQARKPGRS